MSRTRITTLAFILSELLPLDGLRCNFVSAPYLEYLLLYYHDTIQLCGVNIHRTRSLPGADIGSDHDLVMMTFRVHLKKAKKPNQPRIKFDLEKLRDSDVACTFQATIGGKFAPLIGLSDEDMDTTIQIQQ